MRRILALLLACALLLTGCTTIAPTESKTEGAGATAETQNASPAAVTITEPKAEAPETAEPETMPAASQQQSDNAVNNATVSQGTASAIPDSEPNFNELDDPALLRYIQDTIEIGLVGEFQSEDYIIENVSCIYYSKEYLEETAYNSQANIFFGYTLSELDEQFQGTRYVFTLGENGETVVQPFQDYDDTYDRVIRNVAIGTGVILICVTVSVVTGGAGLAPVSMIFAASAKTGATMALSSGLFSGIAAGTVEGIKTGDFDKAVKAAALAGSESFKWGAITGAIAGGISEANALRNSKTAVDSAQGAAKVKDGVHTWQESERAALEKYPGDSQRSFLNGVEVPKNTPGATRPDIVRTVGDHLEAIEVKNYDLSKAANRSELLSELEREVAARVANLPEGSTQRIVLDVAGRGFSAELIESVKQSITTRLFSIYPDIPIDILGAVL